MSIATEITRIQTQKELLRQGLNSKGCSISQGATLEAFVTALDDIETGGGGGSVTPVQPELEYITEGRDKDYLTFKFVESGELYFNGPNGATLIYNISYSKNGGAWATLNPYLENNFITVSEGDEVWVKGTRTSFSSSATNYHYFLSTAKVYISGNVNSLVNFSTSTLPNYCFYKLFYGNPKLDIDSRRGLKLPSTAIGQYSYSYMFYRCTGLTVLPTISATTLAEGCYSYMFGYCYGLTSIPSGFLPVTTLAIKCYYYMFCYCTGLTELPAGLLPATTLTDYCYNYMFYSCTGLTSIPSGFLPATSIASYCYGNMFYNCTGLTELPAGLLPATTLTDYCYYYMFSGCTGLKSIPSGFLPATTLADRCYANMFRSCSGLINVPSDLLPATKAATYCYYYMFVECYSLIIAPDLKCTTLAQGCYTYMFNNCYNLKYIKYYSNTQPSSTYCNSWVLNVRYKGTFYRPTGNSWNTTGTSAIPQNWTITNFAP